MMSEYIWGDDFESGDGGYFSNGGPGGGGCLVLALPLLGFIGGLFLVFACISQLSN